MVEGLPPREEATEGARSGGADRVRIATKTPVSGGEVKYWTLEEERLRKIKENTKKWTYPSTLPSFFPLPLKPGPNSTPAKTPALPAISPM